MLGRSGVSKTGPIGGVIEVSFPGLARNSLVFLFPVRPPRVAANPEITRGVG